MRSQPPTVSPQAHFTLEEPSPVFTPSPLPKILYPGTDPGKLGQGRENSPNTSRRPWVGQLRRGTDSTGWNREEVSAQDLNTFQGLGW